MPISASKPRQQNNLIASEGPKLRRKRLLLANSSSRGFTLIEMTVVLVLLGLMSSMVIPSIQRWFDSVQERAQLTEVFTQLQRLASRAALNSETVYVSNSNWKNALSDDLPALSLPDGWNISKTDNVVFYHSGSCAHGKLELQSPDGKKLLIDISAPGCQINVIR